VTEYVDRDDVSTAGAAGVGQIPEVSAVAEALRPLSLAKRPSSPFDTDQWTSTDFVTVT
jgi:hypothetical protein